MIKDILGNELHVGDLVVYSRGNHIEVGVLAEITEQGGLRFIDVNEYTPRLGNTQCEKRQETAKHPQWIAFHHANMINGLTAGQPPSVPMYILTGTWSWVERSEAKHHVAKIHHSMLPDDLRQKLKTEEIFAPFRLEIFRD